MTLQEIKDALDKRRLFLAQEILSKDRDNRLPPIEKRVAIAELRAREAEVLRTMGMVNND